MFHRRALINTKSPDNTMGLMFVRMVLDMLH